WFTVGNLDGGQFIVIFAGGMIGVIIMRFAANVFVGVLQKRPGLVVAAFAIVGWVGVKLVMLVLSHNDVALISRSIPESTWWKLTFYGVLVGIAVVGWFLSGRSEKKTHA